MKVLFDPSPLEPFGLPAPPVPPVAVSALKVVLAIVNVALPLAKRPPPWPAPPAPP